MFRLHISGENRSAGAMRSSMVFIRLPPVDRLITAAVACLMRGRNAAKWSGLIETPPSSGRRACMCRIDAPASAAAIAWRAMSSGVKGSAADIVGVWIAPVMAQVMIVGARFAIGQSFHVTR